MFITVLLAFHIRIQMTVRLDLRLRNREERARCRVRRRMCLPIVRFDPETVHVVQPSPLAEQVHLPLVDEHVEGGHSAGRSPIGEAVYTSNHNRLILAELLLPPHHRDLGNR